MSVWAQAHLLCKDHIEKRPLLQSKEVYHPCNNTQNKQQLHLGNYAWYWAYP